MKCTLGGPDHNPVIVQALVFPDCRIEACDHDECPTAEAIVCDDCTTLDVGDIATSVEWPCQHTEAP